MKRISRTALLASLSIGHYRPYKRDEIVTQTANNHYGAHNRAGTYVKNLIDRAILSNITKIVSDARSFHYKNTAPWGENGERILLASNIMVYTKGIRDLKQRFEFEVRQFIAMWPAVVGQAQNDLGGMYNPSDYPSTQEVAQAFKFETAFRPVPIEDDFRVEIAEAEIEKIKKGFVEENNKLVKVAMKDVWARLHDPVKRMAERLNETDRTVRREIVDSVKEIVDLIPKLNLVEDPDLDAMRTEVMNELCQHSAKELRTDDKKREVIAAKAQAIVDKMNGIMGSAATVR
jgi:hypothetical protein